MASGWSNCTPTSAARRSTPRSIVASASSESGSKRGMRFVNMLDSRPPGDRSATRVAEASQVASLRRYASTASTRRWSSFEGGSRSFARMLATCFSTAPTVSTSSRGDRRVRAALGHQAEHLELARRERGRAGRRPAARAKSCATTSGSSAVPPRRDAAHGVDEVVDVHDPVLQQVADAAAAVGEQLGRVGLLDVLRDDQHAGLGRALAQRRAPRAAPRRGTSAAAGCRRSRRRAARAAPRARARRRR